MKSMREWIGAPATREQKMAVVRTAKRRGITMASFVRMVVLERTDYNPDRDPEVPGGQA